MNAITSPAEKPVISKLSSRCERPIPLRNFPRISPASLTESSMLDPCWLYQVPEYRLRSSMVLLPFPVVIVSPRAAPRAAARPA